MSKKIFVFNFFLLCLIAACSKQNIIYEQPEQFNYKDSAKSVLYLAPQNKASQDYKSALLYGKLVNEKKLGLKASILVDLSKSTQNKLSKK